MDYIISWEVYYLIQSLSSIIIDISALNETSVTILHLLFVRIIYYCIENNNFG